MKIDNEKLRQDLLDDSYGAFYGGGFGGAMVEALEIENATEKELVDMALEKGINIDKYCRE